MSDRTAATLHGIVSSIVLIFFMWAFVFGVSYNGKRHEINCSFKHGVELSP